MCVLVCLPLVSSSTVAVADAASCTMAAASSSCASAGPSEPTAPTQAQHVARWIDVAESPTWARNYVNLYRASCALTRNPNAQFSKNSSSHPPTADLCVGA